MALNLDFEFEYEFLPRVAVGFVYPTSGVVVEAEAILDTGAEGTLLDSSIADDLGIDLVHAKTVRIGGIGGEVSEAREATLEIFLLASPDLRGSVNAVFAPNVAADYGNLLGLNFMALMDFGLSHRNRLGYLGRPVDGAV